MRFVPTRSMGSSGSFSRLSWFPSRFVNSGTASARAAGSVATSMPVARVRRSVSFVDVCLRTPVQSWIHWGDERKSHAGTALSADRGGFRSRLHLSRLEPAYPGTVQHAQNCVRDSKCRTCCAVAHGRNGKLGRGIGMRIWGSQAHSGIVHAFTLSQRAAQFPQLFLATRGGQE